MADEKPISPAPEIMVRQISQPDHSTGYYSEVVDRSSTRFQQLSPIRRGTPYSSGIGADQKVINLFGNQLFFLIERVPPSGIGGAPQDKFVVWHWGTQQKADNATNAQIDYLSESVNHPGFTRPTTLTREIYEANPTAAYGSPLTALLHIKVTTSGIGYKKSDRVVIAGNLGAKADLVVDEKGEILNVIVTNEGSGYNSDTPPAITFPSATGTGAVAVAIIQPKTAVLVGQKKLELPDNDPYSNEFVQVIRTYQVLPGPWVTSSLIDPDGIVVTVKKRKNLAVNITAVETLSSGIWSETTDEGADSNIAEEVVKSRVVPGNSMTVTKDNEDGTVTTLHRTLKDQTLIAFVDNVSGGIWTRTYQEDPPVFRGFALRCGDKVAWEIVETRLLPGNPIPSTVIDKNGDSVSVTKTLVEASTITTTSVIVSGVWTKTFEEPVSNKVAWKVVEVRSTANALPFYSVEIPNVIPEKMRAALPLITTETTVKGTASLPTLATGDFFRSQQQLDQYTYRLKIVNLSLSALPISYVDHGITEKFGGGPTTITWKLQADSSPDTIDEGLLVIDSRVVLLGNGTHLKNSEIRDGSAWPVLSGAEIDETIRVAVPFTEQVVLRGTVSASVSGDVETGVKPIDYVRDEVTIRTQPTSAFDAYHRSFPGFTSIHVPPELIGIVGYMQKDGGGGDYQTRGVVYNMSGGGRGTGSITTRGSAEASAAVIPEVAPKIREINGLNVKCMHYLFLMPSGSSRAAIINKLSGANFANSSVTDWPNFAPMKQVTIVCRGGKVNVKQAVEAHTSDSINTDFNGDIKQSGYIVNNGGGTSSDIGVTVKTIRIPPTIHGDLSIQMDGADTNPGTQSAACGASVSTGVMYTTLVGVFAVATGSITADDLTGTAGRQTIPASGLYLAHLVPEPHRGSTYIKYSADVIDFGNL